MANRKSGTLAFVISLLLTLLMLGGVYFGFLLYTKAQVAEQKKTDVLYDGNALSPTAEESIRILAVYCEKVETPPSLFILFHYDAPKKSLSFKIIPADLEIETAGRTDTLAGHYDYEGLRGATRAVSVSEGKPVEKYMRITMKGLSNLSDFLGGITAELKEDVETEFLTIKKGRQTLDGRRIAALLAEKSITKKTKEETVFKLLEANLNEILCDKYDSLKAVVFRNCETNLTNYDFSSRQTCLENMGREKSLVLEIG